MLTHLLNCAAQMALNSYADLSSAEFAAVKLGSLPGGGPMRSTRSTSFMHENVNAPETKDWRKEGAYNIERDHPFLF